MRSHDGRESPCRDVAPNSLRASSMVAFLCGLPVAFASSCRCLSMRQSVFWQTVRTFSAQRRLRAPSFQFLSLRLSAAITSDSALPVLETCLRCAVLRFFRLFCNPPRPIHAFAPSGSRRPQASRWRERGGAHTTHHGSLGAPPVISSRDIRVAPVANYMIQLFFRVVNWIDIFSPRSPPTKLHADSAPVHCCPNDGSVSLRGRQSQTRTITPCRVLGVAENTPLLRPLSTGQPFAAVRCGSDVHDRRGCKPDKVRRMILQSLTVRMPGIVHGRN